MKLIPCVEEELRYVRRKSNLWAVLNEFIDSGYDVMEVKDFTHKNAESCSSSIDSAIKRYGFNCTVTMRKERVFLVRNK